MTSPEPGVDDERFGFWTVSGSGAIHFPPPGGPYDAMTPIFNEMWGETVGKHLDKDHSGVADHAEEELEAPDKFGQEDGSVYQRANPDEFESGDET